MSLWVSASTIGLCASVAGYHNVLDKIKLRSSLIMTQIDEYYYFMGRVYIMMIAYVPIEIVNPIPSHKNIYTYA